MRAAIVGTGARAQMWARELQRYGDLVALADTNPGRLAAFQRLIADPPPPSNPDISAHDRRSLQEDEAAAGDHDPSTPPPTMQDRRNFHKDAAVAGQDSRNFRKDARILPDGGGGESAASLPTGEGGAEAAPEDVRGAEEALQAAIWVVTGAADVGAMLRAERVDVLVVCSPDATHDEYIVAGLDAGAHVITEKPMTTDVQKCRRIMQAQQQSAGKVTVAFNYRYHPVHQQVKELLPQIGEISSVHFEWLLDVRHGADYFRRWHREKQHSGGLLVHKSTHHFDLVNWWLDAAPEIVTAHGRLFFYGEEGKRHGYARDYQRAHNAPEAKGDPFALMLAEHPALSELYLDAEEHDGYHRDVNVFGAGVSIEDDMAVLVRYTTGATMSYHLTAFAPWEGYRVAFNGSKGRLELDMVESDHVAPGVSGEVKGHSAALHGAEAAKEHGSVSLRLRHFWQPPQEIPVTPYEKSGHGGADSRMVAAIVSGANAPTAADGARSLLTGLAANESIRMERSVRASDLLDLSEYLGERPDADPALPLVRE